MHPSLRVLTLYLPLPSKSSAEDTTNLKHKVKCHSYNIIIPAFGFDQTLLVGPEQSESFVVGVGFATGVPQQPMNVNIVLTLGTASESLALMDQEWVGKKYL